MEGGKLMQEQQNLLPASIHFRFLTFIVIFKIGISPMLYRSVDATEYIWVMWPFKGKGFSSKCKVEILWAVPSLKTVHPTVFIESCCAKHCAGNKDDSSKQSHTCILLYFSFQWGQQTINTKQIWC